MPWVGESACINYKLAEHVEVGAARTKRDSTDTEKVKDCLVNNSPFRFCDSTKLVKASMSGNVSSIHRTSDI